MKRLVLMLTSVMLVLSACTLREKQTGLAADAPPDQAPNLAGKYIVNGVDPLGTEYSGHLTITAGETTNEYRMQWIVTGSVQEGTGRLEGNRLQVEWRLVEGIGQSHGTATYTITVKGELYGVRIVEGYAGEGEEQAYPNK